MDGSEMETTRDDQRHPLLGCFFDFSVDGLYPCATFSNLSPPPKEEEEEEEEETYRAFEPRFPGFRGISGN